MAPHLNVEAATAIYSLDNLMRNYRIVLVIARHILIIII